MIHQLISPEAPKRLIRVSAQLHNAPADYEKLCAALGPLLAEEAKGERRSAGRG